MIERGEELSRLSGTHKAPISSHKNFTYNERLAAFALFLPLSGIGNGFGLYAMVCHKEVCSFHPRKSSSHVITTHKSTSILLLNISDVTTTLRD